MNIPIKKIGFGLVILSFILELIKPAQKKISLYHDLRNLAVGLLNQLVIAFLTNYIYKNYFKPKENTKTSVIKVFIMVIFIDFWMYWWHRANHIFNPLFKFHAFHHSDEQMNASSTSRFHTGEIILSSLVRALLFRFLRIDDKAIEIYETIFSIIITFHHSDINISRSIDKKLSNFIVSPKLHRIHHDKKKANHNSNYGSVLLIWDQMFGSYNSDIDQKISFGI